jgi:hypothetical protein
MKAIRFALWSFLFVAFFSSPSNGQTGTFPRTFVSGTGTDGAMNTCTRLSPCRTFAYTLTQAAPGGEIVALDSAGYGVLDGVNSVTRSISIIAPPGVYAGISVFSGVGVRITAGASDTVILRGLTVTNQGGNNVGIQFFTGGTLHVESCVVNGFGANGIEFNGPGKLEVKDSILRGNGAAILVAGASVVAIDDVRLEANTQGGLVVLPEARVTVRNSVASGNGAGFLALSDTAAAAELNIENCVASNNDDGIVAQSTSTGIATVRVANSTVTDNGVVGLHNFGSPAVLLSRGNNTVEGNTTNTSGTIGTYTAK